MMVLIYMVQAKLKGQDFFSFWKFSKVMRYQLYRISAKNKMRVICIDGDEVGKLIYKNSILVKTN